MNEGCWTCENNAKVNGNIKPCPVPPKLFEREWLEQGKCSQYVPYQPPSCGGLYEKCSAENKEVCGVKGICEDRYERALDRSFL